MEEMKPWKRQEFLKCPCLDKTLHCSSKSMSFHCALQSPTGSEYCATVGVCWSDRGQQQQQQQLWWCGAILALPLTALQMSQAFLPFTSSLSYLQEWLVLPACLAPLSPDALERATANIDILAN